VGIKKDAVLCSKRILQFTIGFKNILVDGNLSIIFKWGTAPVLFGYKSHQIAEKLAGLTSNKNERGNNVKCVVWVSFHHLRMLNLFV